MTSRNSSSVSSSSSRLAVDGAAESFLQPAKESKTFQTYLQLDFNDIDLENKSFMFRA